MPDLSFSQWPSWYEAILQQALAMSLAGGEDPTTPAPQAAKDEDQATPQAPEKAEGGTSSNLGAMLEDKTFVTSVLSNLPGVDVSDANVQQVLSGRSRRSSPPRRRRTTTWAMPRKRENTGKTEMATLGIILD